MFMAKTQPHHSRGKSRLWLILILAGALATLVSGLYKTSPVVLDASLDEYGFPLYWLAFSQSGWGPLDGSEPSGGWVSGAFYIGYETCQGPFCSRWTFVWLFFAGDLAIYSAVAFAIVSAYAKATGTQKPTGLGQGKLKVTS
jgi:hypothetical protein